MIHALDQRLTLMRLKPLLVIVSLLASASLAVGQQNDVDFRQQAPMVAGGSVKVENGRGDVTVEGWDKAEILVEAHKFFEGSDADRDRWFRETRIRFEGDEHHRVLKVEQPDDSAFHWGFWNGNRGVNVTVHVPRQSNPELRTDRGHVIVQQIAGSLDISSDRGNVDVSGLDGEFRFRGDRGDLRVRDSAIRNGIRAKLDRGSMGIELKNFAGESELEIDRGDISIELPAKSAFTLDAERSRRLSFHTDFGVLARGGFNGDRIHGDVNGGGPTLRLRGDRGSVRVRAASQ